MQALSELVRNIILIIFLTTFLDLIMPSNTMQRFVKVVMGLFILIAILLPIFNLINKEQNLAAFVWQQDEHSALQFNSILEQGEYLEKANHDLAWENYRQKIEKQMETVVKELHGLDVTINTKLVPTANENFQELGQEIIVTVNSANNGEKRERGLLQTQVKTTLFQYFGVKETTQIEIVGGEFDE